MLKCIKHKPRLHPGTLDFTWTWFWRLKLIFLLSWYFQFGSTVTFQSTGWPTAVLDPPHKLPTQRPVKPQQLHVGFIVQSAESYRKSPDVSSWYVSTECGHCDVWCVMLTLHAPPRLKRFGEILVAKPATNRPQHILIYTTANTHMNLGEMARSSLFVWVFLGQHVKSEINQTTELFIVHKSYSVLQHASFLTLCFLLPSSWHLPLTGSYKWCLSTTQEGIITVFPLTYVITFTASWTQTFAVILMCYISVL